MKYLTHVQTVGEWLQAIQLFDKYDFRWSDKSRPTTCEYMGSGVLMFEITNTRFLDFASEELFFNAFNMAKYTNVRLNELESELKRLDSQITEKQVMILIEDKSDLDSLYPIMDDLDYRWSNLDEKLGKRSISVESGLMLVCYVRSRKVRFSDPKSYTNVFNSKAGTLSLLDDDTHETILIRAKHIGNGDVLQ